MSEVEETLERVKVQNGVEGYVICNRQGLVLRRFPQMSQEHAEQYADSMRHLANKARGVVRDLNPQNELRYLRIRAKRHEVMIAFDNEFLVIVIQKWTPAAGNKRAAEGGGGANAAVELDRSLSETGAAGAAAQHQAGEDYERGRWTAGHERTQTGNRTMTDACMGRDGHRGNTVAPTAGRMSKAARLVSASKAALRAQMRVG
eukprot:CAMPEP_0182533540 /NCGR_PEP_ID=MMETSP1323-20130603/13817_1 /TAXON_ID=236787 /ORGANISM="Florenciella parvula, Strain RCC1693" /LENGTH=202 /DNA_ID=CAMNT_0024743437 /DNA_START=40 /DNA_END=647 /DNA_ORIENTATION=-